MKRWQAPLSIAKISSL